MVNATPRPLYHRERPGTHCIWSWVGPGPVWTGAENLNLTGIRSRTVRSVASRHTDWAVAAYNAMPLLFKNTPTLTTCTFGQLRSVMPQHEIVEFLVLTKLYLKSGHKKLVTCTPTYKQTKTKTNSICTIQYSALKFYKDLWKCSSSRFTIKSISALQLPSVHQKDTSSTVGTRLNVFEIILLTVHKLTTTTKNKPSPCTRELC